MILKNKDKYFNFSKWYVMLYYPKQIKRYRNMMGFTIVIGKVIYIIQIKDLFKQTNMRKSYKRWRNLRLQY